MATSPSKFSEDSSIRKVGEGSMDALWSLFRKMIWADRDMAACKVEVDRLRASVGDEETDLFGFLFSAMISANFQRR